ncbi:MAG: TIGR03617 family F420-dependent LLM class oxidoreductase [Chloroflexi bacterium]|nr:TIGR03617 family F420-dependent LLM class oxidoreductase [Chloroflexota bacterium]
MKFDIHLAPASLSHIPSLARQAESIGASGVWANETQHDPFLPLALAAEHTSRIELGTAVAIAFARSPTVVAHTAWDLAELSGGRFRLGLGTQVKAHVERRFGMTWEAPVPRLREYLQAVRVVWDSWQNRTRLNYRGQHYKLTLMTPFFSPNPIDHPRIPIFIAGVNPPLCRLAGELADGFHVHPYHTVKYLAEVVRPAMAEGAARAGREMSAIEIATSTFVILGETEAERAADREAMRAQISFYASTPSYRGVMETHGWGETGAALSALASRGQWGEMPRLIADEMLATFAVEGTWADIGLELRERYSGLADRVSLYRPFTGERADDWRRVADAARSA